MGGPRRVALVGKPNVGKSSLLNRLTGEDRAVVDSVAATTVDPVDSLVEFDGQVWRFVDTAGLRKRVKHASGMEYYASLRTHSAIEAAEVAGVLIDSSEPMSEQDPGRGAVVRLPAGAARPVRPRGDTLLGGVSSTGTAAVCLGVLIWLGATSFPVDRERLPHEHVHPRAEASSGP